MTKRSIHRLRLDPIDALWLAGLGGFVVAISLSLWSPFVLDCDVSNLALGIEHFDIHQHQPHPPGYLGYVMLLRLAHAVSGDSLLDTTRLLSRMFAILTVGLVWGAARAYAPDRRGVRIAASLLTATNAVFLYYAVDGQTHSAEGAMAAGLVWALAAGDSEVLSWRRVALVGLLLAAGGSLRPSFALLAVLPVIWVLWFDLRRLLAVAVIGAVGTAAWFLPTVALSGGLRRYQETSDALIGAFIRITSALSSEHNERALALNLRNTLFWSVLALGLAVVVWAVGRGRHAEPTERRAGVVLLTMALPAVAFYVLVLCAEAGYLSGLVPPASVYVAMVLFRPGSDGRRAAIWTSVLALGQLGLFLFLPYGLGRTFMLPTVAEVVSRETRSEIMWERVRVPGDEVLVISDFPDPTILRQFPILDAHIEIALFYTQRIFSLNKHGALTLASAHGWRTVPGRALNVDGPERELTVPTAYRWVVIDPRTSNFLRAELRAQVAPGCVIADRDEQFSAPRLDAGCFVGGTIDFEGLALHFSGQR